VAYSDAKKLMTVAETAPFIRQAAKLWTEADRHDFVDFIAANPDAGDVIPDPADCARFAGVGRVSANAAGCG
jgi:hypothetical protein